MSFLQKVLQLKIREKNAFLEKLGTTEKKILEKIEKIPPKKPPEPPKKGIIAEVKKSSPSHGKISDKNHILQAQTYEKAGAVAISVLTDKNFFNGSITYLAEISQKVKIPTLRKDFIVSPAQVFESYLAGARFFLLIAELVGEELENLISTGRRLGLEPLVEFFSKKGLETTACSSAKFVGINNRNLENLDVSLERGLELFLKAKKIFPPSTVFVIESGISSPEDLEPFLREGAKLFLVGTSLMKAENPAELLGELTRKINEFDS